MSSRRGGSTSFKHSFRGGHTGRGGGRFESKPKSVAAGSLLSTDITNNNEKFEAARLSNSIDELMGFQRYEAGPKKVGWLVNMHTVCGLVG